MQSKLWTAEIAKIIAYDYREVYPELDRNIGFVVSQLKDEEVKFNKTLEKGLKEFAKIHADNIISGIDAFNLYQTYGFPIEMVEELAEEKGLKVDEKEFEKTLFTADLFTTNANNALAGIYDQVFQFSTDHFFNSGGAPMAGAIQQPASAHATIGGSDTSTMIEIDSYIVSLQRLGYRQKRENDHRIAK